MSEYKLSEETLNALLQYLGTKPYGEVATHIAAVQQAIPLVEKEAPVEKINRDITRSRKPE